MKYRFLLGATAALATTLSVAGAQAQLMMMPSGPMTWYFGGEGGWTNLENQRLRTPIGSGTQKFDDGFNIGARAGMEWGPWRFEEEFRFQQNGDTSIAGIPVNGDRNAYAIMTNAIYDFTFGWPITPHLGGGIGVIGVRDGASLKRPVTFRGTTFPAGTEITHGTDWNFGYQAIGGIRYNINPALAFDLDYRYLATADDSTFRSGPSTGNAILKSGYSTHNLVASLSWRFGAPPPPPPPPAPPMPPMQQVQTRKVFLVFFDWDRDTITADGMAIIRQAADAFKAGGNVQIQVTGYADRSGSPGYNQRLSERRASNVANAMVRMGVPRQAMAVSGRGENDNRVPTADGVREPQNRRVEIVFP